VPSEMGTHSAPHGLLSGEGVGGHTTVSCMAMLRFFPAEGSPRLFAITKPVFTIGRSEGNDVTLREPGVLEHHAQIVYTGRDFQLEELDRGAEIQINGKRKRRSRLVDGDRLALGDAHIGFSMFSEPARSSNDSESRQPLNDVAGLRKLFEFSERLMTRGTVDELLEALLDGVIQVTGAARGAVLLVDPSDDGASEPRLRASRNVQRDALEG